MTPTPVFAELLTEIQRIEMLRLPQVSQHRGRLWMPN